MDFLHRMLYTAVGAFSIFYFFVKVSLSHWKKRGILHEKPKFLWGNLKGVGTKRHITEALNEIYERYKGKAPFIGVYAWLRPLVLILDVELARRILIADAEHFMARGLYSNMEDDPLSENLIQLDGCAYRIIHRKGHCPYKCSSMFVPALVRVSETFRRSVAEKHRKCEIMNIRHLVSAYNVDAVSLVAFGLEGDTLTLPHTQFHLMSQCFLNKVSFFKLYLAWSFPELARVFCFRIFDKIASQYFVDLVRTQLQQRGCSHSAEPITKDFLQNFVGIEREQPLSDDCYKRIAAQCFSFLLAGLEASTSTLSFCLHELALHSEVQEKARREIDDVLTKHKDKITAESLRDMVYLKQILYETLRKHSPYPFLLRNTLIDYEVPDSVFMLQTGNSIIIPTSSIHHDPVIYPNPQLFDPSRFDAAAVAARNPATFLPFGAGPRACPTREFAEFQMLVCLVTLLQQYKFSTCSQTNISMQYDQKRLIVVPKDEILLHLERI